MQMFSMFKEALYPVLSTQPAAAQQLQTAFSCLEKSVIGICTEVGSTPTENPKSALPHGKSSRATHGKGRRKLSQQSTPTFVSPSQVRAQVQHLNNMETVPLTPHEREGNEIEECGSSGRSHKGSQNKAYPIYTRLLCVEDYAAGVPVSEIMRKYEIKSERSIRRWLIEWGNDVYDEAAQWGVETCYILCRN